MVGYTKPRELKGKTMGRGKRYDDAAKRFDRDRLHSSTEAIELVQSLAAAKFDESIELVIRLGIDTVIGIGAVLATVGGAIFFLALYIGVTSSLAVVLPMTVYLAGLGMVLPQSIAGAMTPFPDRAGAASSLFGFIQQAVAALCGALVGLTLDRGAMPLAAAVAIMGTATLAIWLATRGIRKSHAAVHDV